MVKRYEKGGERFYTLDDGRVYPSVTTILQIIGKPALISWAASMERNMVIEASANLYSDLSKTGVPLSKTSYVTSLKDRLGKERSHQKMLATASEIGTQVHSLIEWNIKRQLGDDLGPPPEFSPKAGWAFSVWEKWAKDVGFTPLMPEGLVYSHVYQYAGTMDLLARMRIDGKEQIVVVDWKTGKAIYDEALLQNAAYVHAVIEMGLAPGLVHGLIVRLPKDEKKPDPEMRLIRYEEHPSLFSAFLHARALWSWHHNKDKEAIDATPAGSPGELQGADVPEIAGDPSAGQGQLQTG